jgi:AraC-like DNA-binding protein
MADLRHCAPRHAMPATPRHLRQPPFSDTLPAPIFFRAAWVPAETAYPQHRHAWGEFVYSFSGVMEVKLADRHYTAPPPYGIWLPPQVEHTGLNHPETCHCSLYVSAPLCDKLPRDACVLIASPLLRALLDHLRQWPAHVPGGAPPSLAHERLLQVVVDQLEQAPRAGSYLPSSDDPLLAPVLQALQATPGDNRSLADWARVVHTTERTLVRRCQRDLGMGLVEWRQRLRIVKALPRLETGEKIEAIAFDLGYASVSAFIAMFRRLMGVTPDAFRKGSVATHAVAAL